MNKKIKSIKTKIIMFLIPMLLIAFVLLSELGYRFASNSLKESNLNVMSEMTKTAATRADDQIKSDIKNLGVIASNPVIRDENVPLENKVDILNAALKSSGQLSMSISDENGKSIDTSGNKKEMKTTQGFMKSIKGEDYITNPYVDPVTSKKVISYSVPIKDSADKIIGVITSVKDCMDFSVLNKETTFLKTGNSMIVDSNGNFIVAEDESLVTENKNITNMTSDKESLTDLNNIGKSMTSGSQSGIGKYTYEGKVKYMSYSPIGKTGLAIGITVEEKDLLSALNSLAIVDTVVTVVMILLICALIIGFTIRVINRLLGAKSYVDSIAKGDFYSQIDKKYIKVNDEISEICASVGQAKASVGKMIKSVRDNANVVRDGSLSLSEIAEQLSVLTEEISASIGEVALSTNNQSSEFEEITNKLVQFGEKINVVKDNVQSISQDVLVINEKSLVGTDDIKQLNEGIISVNDSFEKFGISIEYIHGDMKNVSEIVNIINGISEQINLLAFNAAIEAASAGEAGRGFNVIAQEVRKLSDKSKESAQNIAKIIGRLVNVINKVVEESKNMDSELDKQKNKIYEASSSFSEIAVLVKEITPKVSNIDSAFKDITYNKDLIVDTVYELSEELKSTSGSLEQVTDSSVELAIFAEKVNDKSNVLLDKANDLIAKVRRFRIEQTDSEKSMEELLLNESESAPIEDNTEKMHEVSEDIGEGNLELPRVEELSASSQVKDKPKFDSATGVEEIHLALIENYVDLSLSPLEELNANMPTKDFGWGCSKVTELKNYIKQRDLMENEDELEDLSGYNIS